MAPYSPALGPRPEETPKANARGKATIPAVIPPKASPLILEKKVFIKTINLGIKGTACFYLQDEVCIKFSIFL